MLKDVIGEILEAEKKSDETLKKAEADCRAILDEAGVRAGALVKQAAEEEAAETRRIVEEAQKSTDKRIKDHEKELESVLVSSSSISGEAAEKAANDILKLLVHTAVGREE